MMSPPELSELSRRRRHLQDQLAGLGELRPGSLTPRYRREAAGDNAAPENAIRLEFGDPVQRWDADPGPASELRAPMCG